MQSFWICAGYLLFLGIASHVIGEAVPRRLFNPGAFPYRCFPFENGGKIYSAVKVEKWKDIVPDMSRYFPKMVAKRVRNHSDSASLEKLLVETCVAEATHHWLSVFGLACLWIMPGAGGIIITAVWIILGNLPFIIIQRFNRPRIAKLLKIKQKHGGLHAGDKNSDTHM